MELQGRCGLRLQRPRDAVKLRPFYQGKTETALKCACSAPRASPSGIRPSLSAPRLEANDDSEKAYEYASEWNAVAVTSDGICILRAGDIGPKAGMPAMDGKSPVHKYLGGAGGFLQPGPGGEAT